MTDNKVSLPRKIGKSILSGGQTVYRHCLSRETRWSVINITYMLFAILMLFHHVYVTIYYRTIVTGSTVFSTAWIVFAAISALLGYVWKDKGFWFLAVLFAIRWFRFVHPFIGWTPEHENALFMGLYAYFCCYSVGRVFNRKWLTCFVYIFCFLWSICMAVFSALSIYAVASGTDIKNLGTLEFGIQDNRLFPIYHYSEGGILCGVSIAVAAVGLCMAKQKTIKAVYAVCALLTFICGSLTLARAEYILNAITFSIFTCVFISRHLKTSGFWHRKVPLALAAVLLIVAVSAVQVPLTKMMIGVLQPGNRSRTGASLPEKVQQMIIPSARAETTEQDEEQKEIEPLISRPYKFSNGLDGLLTGRIGIWESGIYVFIEQPEILLSGRSVIWTMDPIWAYRESKGLFWCAHLHNIILQIILENGLPALLFFLLFTGYFFRRAFLLFRNKELPLWERIIGLPAILCFVADMVDITCHVDRGLPQMTLLYLFAGLTVALSWIELPRKKHLNRKPVPDTCNDGE